MSQFIEMFGNPVANNKGWSTMALKQVAPEEPSRERQTGTVWILNLDMIESHTGKIIDKVYDEDTNLLSVAPFDEGNVLYSKLRPYLNKVVIPKGKGYATTELVPLRPNQEYLNLTFFSHLLRGDDFVTYANTISSGTKMPRMPLNDLRNFQCILPPMEEQLKFEKVAEQADKSKFVGFKSQFIEMFGNTSKEMLGKFIQVVRGVSYKPSDVKTADDPDTAVILRSNNINDANLNTDEVVYINKNRVSGDQYLRVNDIVVCASNGSKALVGKAAINKTLTNQYAHGAFCLLVRPNDNINPVYLNTFFQTSLYKKQIDELAAGSNILNIKQEYLTNMILPLPIIEEQNKFAIIAEQADKSEYYN